MVRRSTILVLSLVLCGVMALSVPAFADRNSQQVTTSGSTVTARADKAASSTTVAKTPSVRTIAKNSVGFWLRHFLGLPPIQIETKPPDKGEPLKSVGEKGNSNNWTGKPIETDVDQDHGGDGIER